MVSRMTTHMFVLKEGGRALRAPWIVAASWVPSHLTISPSPQPAGRFLAVRVDPIAV